MIRGKSGLGRKMKRTVRGIKTRRMKIWMSTVMMAMKTRRKKITPV
jgi:hypothetical protein